MIESFTEKCRYNSMAHLETSGAIMGRKNTDGTYTATNIVIPEQIVSSVKTEFTEEGLNSLFKFTLLYKNYYHLNLKCL